MKTASSAPRRSHLLCSVLLTPFLCVSCVFLLCAVRCARVRILRLARPHGNRACRRCRRTCCQRRTRRQCTGQRHTVSARRRTPSTDVSRTASSPRRGRSRRRRPGSRSTSCRTKPSERWSCGCSSSNGSSSRSGRRRLRRRLRRCRRQCSQCSSSKLRRRRCSRWVPASPPPATTCSRRRSSPRTACCPVRSRCGWTTTRLLLLPRTPTTTPCPTRCSRCSVRASCASCRPSLPRRSWPRRRRRRPCPTTTCCCPTSRSRSARRMALAPVQQHSLSSARPRPVSSAS